MNIGKELNFLASAKDVETKIRITVQTMSLFSPGFLVQLSQVYFQ